MPFRILVSTNEIAVSFQLPAFDFAGLTSAELVKYLSAGSLEAL